MLGVTPTQPLLGKITSVLPSPSKAGNIRSFLETENLLAELTVSCKTDDRVPLGQDEILIVFYWYRDWQSVLPHPGKICIASTVLTRKVLTAMVAL